MVAKSLKQLLYMLREALRPLRIACQVVATQQGCCCSPVLVWANVPDPIPARAEINGHWKHKYGKAHGSIPSRNRLLFCKKGEATGWSRIEFNGQEAYVSSDYLSTTKPQVSTSSSSGGTSSGSTQTSKPSTGSTSGGTGGGNHQTTTDGSEIDTGSEDTYSDSSDDDLYALGEKIQKQREEPGYDVVKIYPHTEEEIKWIADYIRVGS